MDTPDNTTTPGTGPEPVIVYVPITTDRHALDRVPAVDGLSHAPVWEIIRCCNGHPPVMVCGGDKQPWPCDYARQIASVIRNDAIPAVGVDQRDDPSRDARAVLRQLADRVLDPLGQHPAPGCHGRG